MKGRDCVKLAQYYNLMDKASREHKVAGFMREYNTRLYAQGVKDGFLLSLPITERRAALMDREVLLDAAGKPHVVFDCMDDDPLVLRYENSIQ